MTGRPAKC